LGISSLTSIALLDRSRDALRVMREELADERHQRQQLLHDLHTTRDELTRERAMLIVRYLATFYIRVEDFF
jgi:hypothetical protein